MSILGNPIIIGLNPAKMLPVFSYSGSYRFDYDKLSNGTYNWELAFLSGSGTNLNFSRVTDKIDIFIVGSGANGGHGSSNPDYQYYAIGGKGGNGGEIKTLSNITIATNTNYPVTIGSAGNITSINIGGTTYSCSSGTGKVGGDGAVVYGNASIATVGQNGQNGVYAFGSSNTKLWPGYRYGASGGGGGTRNAQYYVIRGYGTGGKGPASGSGGAGNGGAYNQGGKNATANSGCGGGGGGYDQENYNDYDGGIGGSGIIIIRNHRS